MDKEARIYVAGNTTVLGTAIVRTLHEAGYTNLVGRGDTEPDPTSRVEVDHFFALSQPDFVFIAAGKSGGIKANQQRGADLMEHNLRVVTTLIPAAHRHGVKKLLYLGSACVYPRECPQPMTEDYLMDGPLEPTSGPYSVAKIAGIHLVQAFRQQYDAPFIAAIPTNYFGPGDTFDPENSHVIPGLMRRMDDARHLRARDIEVWGSGKAIREFLPVADLARACIHAMQHYNETEPINLANGHALSIAEAAETIASIVGFQGAITFDDSSPDGAPKRILDGAKLRALGWEPEIPFAHALEELYVWYRNHVVTAHLESGAA